jgi:cytochrome b561
MAGTETHDHDDAADVVIDGDAASGVRPETRNLDPAQMPRRTEQRADISELRPPEDYTASQRRMHWVVAALVLLQLVVGCYIGMLHSNRENASVLHALLPVHLIVGTIIFGLMVKRWQMRRRLGAPPPPVGTPPDAVILANISHRGFYVLLLAMPIIGWLAYGTDGRAASLFGGIHGGLAVTLAGGVCAHLAGVAYHTLIRRDDLLRRMLPR